MLRNSRREIIVGERRRRRKQLHFARRQKERRFWRRHVCVSFPYALPEREPPTLCRSQSVGDATDQKGDGRN